MEAVREARPLVTYGPPAAPHVCEAERQRRRSLGHLSARDKLNTSTQRPWRGGGRTQTSKPGRGTGMATWCWALGAGLGGAGAHLRSCMHCCPRPERCPPGGCVWDADECYSCELVMLRMPCPCRPTMPQGSDALSAPQELAGGSGSGPNAVLLPSTYKLLGRAQSSAAAAPPATASGWRARVWKGRRAAGGITQMVPAEPPISYTSRPQRRAQLHRAPSHAAANVASQALLRHAQRSHVTRL